MNHRTFTMLVILVTFTACLVFGSLYVLEYIDDTGFFLCMIATLPVLLVFRSVFNLLCKNKKR